MKQFLAAFFILCTTFVYAQDEVPSIELTTLNGKKVNLQEYANGDNLTIISLWATWCVPCLKELDAISEVYEDWQDETEVELIAISIDDSRTIKRVKPLINGKGWDYTILLDTNNNLKRAIGAVTVPLTFLVKDGKVVYRHSGYSQGVEDELYEKIQEYSK